MRWDAGAVHPFASGSCFPGQRVRVGTRGVPRRSAPAPSRPLQGRFLCTAPFRTCAVRPWRLWTSEVGPGRGRRSGLAPRGSGALPAGLRSAPPAGQSPPRGGAGGDRCAAVTMLGSWKGRAEKLPKKQLSWMCGRLGACARGRLGKNKLPSGRPCLFRGDNELLR